MELPYSYNAKEGWYKPDGQSQTVIMRRTSTGTPSLSTTSPTTSQPNSRTGTIDSGRSAGRENRDPNATTTPHTIQHTHAHQPPAAAHLKFQPQPQTGKPGNDYDADTLKSRANNVEKRFIGQRRDWTPQPIPVPSPPSSSVYSYGSALSSAGGNSMERSLLPKRRGDPGSGNPSRSARPPRAGARFVGAGAAGKAKLVGQGAKNGKVGKRSPSAGIYVNELGPNGSWYIPKQAKEKSAAVSPSTATRAGAVEPGLMKVFLNAFKKKNKVVNAPLPASNGS